MALNILTVKSSIISKKLLLLTLDYNMRVSKPLHRVFPIVSFTRGFGQPASQTHPHLIAEGEVTPGLTKAEFHQRRCNLVKSALSVFRGLKSVNHHLFIIPSASTVYMINDIPYPFRQNTDFLYFSGFQEPDSVLLIEANSKSSSNGEHVSYLFVPRRDPAKELWDGPRSGVDGALAITGVDAAFNSGEVEKFLQMYNKDHKDFVLWYNHGKPVNAGFHSSVISNLMLEKRHKCMEDVTAVSQRLRLIKSPAEIQLMQQSNKIASEGFVEVMKFSKPQVNEAHLWAKMDFECRVRGAEFLAYPPVVAGGSRANIIHYITNNQVIAAGELVLMDAGCEFHGYTSDLTRTWPVSGQFTSAQRKLYNATLRIQEECIRMCTPEHSLDEIYNHMLILLVAELTQLGVVPPGYTFEQRWQLARQMCPHHVSHYLGMDVHDTSGVSRKIRLEPSMVVTVEPGIYISENEYRVSPEFRGIGIRIEDNILVTDSQPVNLSVSCPKQADEIEDIMSRGR